MPRFLRIPICLAVTVFAGFAAAWGVEKYEPKSVDPFEESWRFNEIEGLNDEEIRCFDVGPDGVLWVGLTGTIVRYDGENYRSFGVEEGLEIGAVRSIKVISDSQVYALNNKALYYYDGGEWRIIQEGLFTRGDPAFKEDGMGRLWFASGRRLARVSGEEVRMSERVTGEVISDFCIDHEGFFWVITERQAVVSRFERKGNSFERKETWPAFEPIGERRQRNARSFKRILQDQDLRIWFVSHREQTPVYSLNYGEREWVAHDLEAIGGTHRNSAIHETSDGILRVIGEEALHRFDGEEWSLYDNSRFRLTNNGCTMLESEEGMVWLAEQFVSLRRINYGSSKWQSFQDLSFEAETEDGLQWFLERSGKVVSYDPSSNDWWIYDQSDGLLSDPTTLMVGPSGVLRATGGDNGVAAVSSFQGHSWKTRLYPELGSRVRSWTSLETDGVLYLGGMRGAPLDSGTGRGTKLAKHHLDQDVVEFPTASHLGMTSLKELPDGRIMMGGSRLSILENDRSYIFENQSDSWFDYAHDLEIAPDGTIWVANWGDGVWRLKGDEWELFSKKEGLNSEYVSDLLIQKDGTVAAFTSNGLNRFDGSSWLSTPLPQFEAVRGGSSIRQSNDGSIWVNVGTRAWYHREVLDDENRGTFKTLRYRPDGDAPDTVAMIAAEPEKHASSILLRWSGTDRWADTATADLQYSFRIDGGDWSPFRNETTRYFQHLREGKRFIEVRARDGDGNIDLTPASISFLVTVPFWQTNWFIGAVVAIVLLIVGLVIALLLQRARHANELGQQRMHFMTHISHELRSPLTLIAGPLEKMAELSNLPELARKSLTIAQRNTSRLRNLVGQLLELRKLESGNLRTDPQSVDVVAFLKMAGADFDNHARSRSQRVFVEASEESLTLEIDPDAYRKILDNLILNALKYSDEGSSVTVRMHSSFGESENTRNLQLIVEDEGPGISKDELPQIFDAYYSARKPKARGTRSYGLGLSLVKSLVELNGGRIKAQSPVSNDGDFAFGTRFVLDFSEVSLGKVTTTDSEKSTSLIEFPKNVLERHGDEVVIVIDDQSEVRDFISESLSDTFSVYSASGANEGILLAREKIPDVILSDIVMPDMDGIDFCRQLKSIPELSHIPVILQTSLPSEENQKAGLGAGAIDFVAKPISISELKMRIRNQIDIRKRFAEQIKANLMRPEEEESEAISSESAFIAKAKKLLGERYSDSAFSVEVFATKMGMSRSSFYRKFQAIANMSPADFIKSFRLDKATTLLMNGLSVSEVAFQTGYTEASPFNRAFKKRYGCTPSEYRRGKGVDAG